MSFPGKMYIFSFMIFFAKINTNDGTWWSSPSSPKPKVVSKEPSPVLKTSGTKVLNWTCDVIPPRKCPNPDVRFFLYTSAHAKTPIEMDVNNPDSIRNAPFNSGPIKFIIHGFANDKDTIWYTTMRKEYFRGGRIINVIQIDYSPLCRPPCYFTAIKNTVVVGMCAAQFFERLLTIRTDIQVSRIHMIGLSLGAQVGAQISRFWKNGQIERLTGLDAAGFGFPSTFSDDITIKKGQAKFVDGLHTTSGTFGQLLPFGDADFEANGGFIQPACKAADFGCSHSIAAFYWAESINSPTAFKAYPCTLLISSKVCQALGTGPPVYFGDNVTTSARGVYGFTTNAKQPYGTPTDYDVYRLF